MFCSPLLLGAAAAVLTPWALAQMPGMPGMPAPGSPTSAPPETAPAAMAGPTTLRAAEEQHTSSGTSMQPPSSPVPMLMGQWRGWTGMLHGEAFVADIQQEAKGERGGDKLFSTNWLMPMAQHPWGPGTLTLRTMLSLEPATITGRFYPELFQQGETAYGVAIADGQHPHDFVMELGALYDVPLGAHGLLSVYAAPVGDPAIGPTAYPHRMSASEDPIAPLGHHQEDSTHIAFNVLTLGLTWRAVRVEGSGFHGAEPDEHRWAFQPSPNGHAVDSDAVRVTWVPGPDWAAQYSLAHIASPEALEPGVNQRRQTASVMWNKGWGGGAAAGSGMAGMAGMAGDAPGARANWAVTALWGQTRASTGLLANSYLAESLLRRGANFFQMRVEWADRTSELLRPAPPEEVSVGHVGGYSFGYDHEWRVGAARVAPGAQFTLDHAPTALAGQYGRWPVGGVAFVRVRLGR